MKTTENFKKAIQNHLNKLAEKDSLFSETLKKKNKNIKSKIEYHENNRKF
ncbi:PcfK-like protein [Polaribacter phage Danklef_4]|nr:PcfK-like protein [Polaribacter phage Danklef_4]